MVSEIGEKIYLTIITFWSWWWEVENEGDKLACTLLTITVPTLFFLWYKWILSYYSLLPPGPYGLPIVGYLPFLSSNLHEQFTEMSHRYGPIFSLWLGSKLHVVVNSVDLAKVVARDLDQTFANRSPPYTALALTYGGIDIAWSNNNTHWRTIRKVMVNQVMSNANLDACQGFRTDEVRKTVNGLYRRMGTKISLHKVAFHTEFNLITSMLWGCSKSGERNNSSYSGDEILEIELKTNKLLVVPNISDFFPMLSPFDLQGKQRDMRKQREHLDKIFDNIIHGRSSTKIEGAVEEDGRKDFLQTLLELKDHKDVPISFNINLIKALLMDVMVAATDTTSTVVEWAMTEILLNPRIKTKIQEELNEVIGMKMVEESDLPKLTYLDAVIKETLRAHPALPLLIQRCPNKSCQVGGYTIPKGTIVYINAWAIHHDPQNWTNPSEFRPERFLNEKWDYKGNNFKFLPFGSGRRMCPGIPLGEKMVMYILASLLHSFEWSLPKHEEVEVFDETGLVTRKRKSLVAIPSQRLSDATLYDY